VVHLRFGEVELKSGEVKLRFGGVKLKSEGVKLRFGGVKLKSEGVKLKSEGVKLKSRGVKLRFGGVELKSRGYQEELIIEKLYYNRYRWYNSETGCYISQDPIGLAGNNPTLYAFVKNVNTEIDPLGLECSQELSNGQNIQELLASGDLPDRNGLTRAGRALQKHSNRLGSVFEKPLNGQKKSDYNAKGSETLSYILNDNNATVSSNRYGGFDVKDSSGRGARFDGEGIFMGFLEP